MDHFQELLEKFNSYDRTAESIGIELRMNLSAIIVKRCSERGWTQKDLAAQMGKAPSFVNRLIQGDSNCTFGIAAEVLHALGLRASLVASPSQHAAPKSTIVAIKKSESIYGQEAFRPVRNEPSQPERFERSFTAVAS